LTLIGITPTANFLKKVGQKLLIRPFGPGFILLRVSSCDFAAKKIFLVPDRLAVDRRNYIFSTSPLKITRHYANH